MTHHRPLCEEMACEVCDQPECTDRVTLYNGNGDVPEADRYELMFKHMQQKLDDMQERVDQIGYVIDSLLAAVLHFAGGDDR